MSKFKEGDKVVREDGRSFSNNATVITVQSHNHVDDTVWLKETNTWASADSLRLYIDPTTVETSTIDFKVGDMVEVINTNGCSGYYNKLGEVGVVTAIQCGSIAKYDLVETSLLEGRQMHRNTN